MDVEAAPAQIVQKITLPIINPYFIQAKKTRYVKLLWNKHYYYYYYELKKETIFNKIY